MARTSKRSTTPDAMPLGEPVAASTSVPRTAGVLGVLTHARIAALARELGVVVLPETATKQARIDALLEASGLALGDALAFLTRDELKAALRVHGLPDAGRSRTELAGRLRRAGGEQAAALGRGALGGEPRRGDRAIPEPGDVVRVRHRQWLVEGVTPPPAPGHATCVALVCLDDDDPGRALEVLWELELGARVLEAQAHGLGTPDRLDPPRSFAAYLHALEWSAVTATDAKLFQSPFRAGIRLMAHQLAPLRRALELPRANVFVADDVGLGKTIEAGLVMQELLLRQRVAFVLVVCPAAVSLQWRDELQQRFGLRFELYNRAFVGRCRQERGFSVNPWATHNRFVISYPLLRRPEHREALLRHLEALAGGGHEQQGEKARKSLLVLDEAHTAAPASASRYAVDSRVTVVVRDVAQRFENRLFLSATPHNGHTNSFAALLELLDPQRFTRTFQPRPELLRSVMVRRLKGDLPSGEFPERKVHTVVLEHEGGRWWQRGGEAGDVDLGPGSGAEIELSAALREYAPLCKPRHTRGRLVLVNLQKRLLSSVEAFWRTLQVHAEAVAGDPERWTHAEAEAEAEAETEAETEAEAPLPLSLPGDAGGEDDEDEVDDDARDQADGATVAAGSRQLPRVQGRARVLLDTMLARAAAARHEPDAKLLALLAWIREHQCPVVAVGGVPADASARQRRWSDVRVLVFTEYGDTKRWLVGMLEAAVAGSERAGERVLQLHGGMSDEQRDEVQRAFNSPPGEHPVRILVCTDAAREGVNLQAHCADLFHFDIPWNPARMEQRNGRIDRTLQPSPQVRCRYFVLPQRAEDRVLRTVVEKVGVIRRELGSLGAVVMDQLALVLEARGIDEGTAERLAAAEVLGGRREVVARELEEQRAERGRIEAELLELSRMLNASRKALRFDPLLLREAIDVGLELAGAEPLREDEHEKGLWHLPALPPSWQPTLDTLRPPRGREELLWEWRKRPPRPLVLEPPTRMDGTRVHVHLSHPLVQRVLGRFLAQGYGAHDLRRVTVVRNRHDHLARVIAFGRLTLFGPGAVRLHDQLVSVAAPWLGRMDGGEPAEGHLRPFADRADRNAVDMLERALAEGPTLEEISEKTRARLLAGVPEDFAGLWPHVRDEAESLAHEAGQRLAERGVVEAEALREILRTQRVDIEGKIDDPQLRLEAVLTESERAQAEQLERDKEHLRGRLRRIDVELEREPEQIRGLYRVTLRRLEPVGLVYLWPATRG